MKSLLVRLGVGCVLAWAMAGSVRAADLHIGILSFEPKETVLKKWQETARYLGKQMPQSQVEFVPLGYEELNAAVKYNTIDFIFTNPEHYVVLRNAYGISPLVTLNSVVGKHAISKFGSVIFTRRDNVQIQHLADVQKRRVAAVDLYSLGGFLAAADTFRQEHIDLRSSDVQSLKFLGTPHEKVVTSVMSGESDVGIVRTGVLESMAQQGKIDFSQIRVLNIQPDTVFPQVLSTQLYPEWPLSAMPQVSPDLSKSLTMALLQLAPHSPAARSGQYLGFSPPANYASVEELMRRLKVYPGVETYPLWKEIWLEYTKEVQWAGLVLLLAGLASTAYFWRANIRLRRMTALYNDAQGALQEERTQLEYIIEGTNAGTWQFNIKTGQAIINRRWAEMAGYSLGDPAKWNLQKWISLCHPNDKLRVMRAFRRHCQGHSQHFTCEYRIRHREGHWIWVQDRGSLSTKPDSASVDWVYGTHTDESARILAQQNHAEQLAFVEVLLENLPVAVYIKDKLGRYIRFNRAFEKLFGIQRDEWIGKTVFDLVPGDQGLYMHQRDQELFETGLAQTYEAAFATRPDHQKREGLYYKTLLKNLQGEAMGLIGTVVDVSERNLAARNLETSNRTAQAATQAKGYFLANVSHELRTPMHAVLGMLKLLHTTPLTERQFEYTHKAESAASGLLVLLDDILDFSKLDAGAMCIDPQPFALETLMRNIATLLSATPRKNHVDILFDLDAQLPHQLLGDNMRLQQILINLASNAIKFTERGHVVIGIKNLSLPGAELERVRLLFSVRDSGIGIAEENFDRIFAEFSQAESSTTRKYGGTGLGLAICKRLINLMGGEIRLESQLGVGTTFSFELEFPGAPQPQAIASATPLPSAREIKEVLIVDDNAVCTTLLVKVTQSLGWSTEAVQSGKHALEIVRQRQAAGIAPHDLVILDWQMPGMDGWETLAQLRKLLVCPPAALPMFIMLSAKSRESLAQRTHEEQESLDGFISKPVTASMLREAVQRKRDEGLQIRGRNRASKRQLEGLKVLVVEDNLLNQQVAEELLSSEGALVYLAENGRVAVNALSDPQADYDAVLMDIQMPVMDGFAATREIRQGLRLLDLPIIGLTANALPIDRANCLAAGMNEHMGKPFDLRELVSLLIRTTGHIPAPTASAEVDTPGEKTRTTMLVNHVIDVQGALHRMGGMEPLYIRSARTLHEALGALPQQLRDALEQGDPALACTLVHTQKGTCATLGLMGLSAQLANLEKQLRAAPVHDNFSQHIDALDAPIREARAALLLAVDYLQQGVGNNGASPPGPAQRLPGAQVLSGLQAMQALLQQSDLSALEHYATLRDTLQGLPEDAVATLEDAMQALDFEQALRACNQLMAQLQKIAP